MNLTIEEFTALGLDSEQYLYVGLSPNKFHLHLLYSKWVVYECSTRIGSFDTKEQAEHVLTILELAT